jgi:23S rRNA (guanosine2251-2'-O)-methyltransferase
MTDKTDKPDNADTPAKKQHSGAPHWRKQKPSQTGFRPRDNAPDGEKNSEPIIFGMHAVEAALRNPARVVKAAFFTDNAERRLADALTSRTLTITPSLTITPPLKITPMSPRDLDRRLGSDTVHQGALLEVEPLPEPTLDQLLSSAQGRPIILLDQVTDPHNVGAILRSAAVFGAAGMVMTRRHSPEPWGVLAKSASGALELVTITYVPNLARAIAELREAFCTVIGLDGDGPQSIDTYQWPDQVAIVLGAEGKGLRHLTRDSCDTLCRIGADGPLASLNVSNAAAVTLHLASMRRRGVA